MINTNVFFDLTDVQVHGHDHTKEFPSAAELAEDMTCLETAIHRHFAPSSCFGVDPNAASGKFFVHVGCTRCVTFSTANNMKIRARITLNVEFIRTCIFYFYFMFEYNYEYDQY